jgi:hypothetical protein
MVLENGHPGLAQLLLDHGADPNTRYINGLTLLLLKEVSINKISN